ncbi:MAG: hypothetical protein LBH35_07325 [Treponema sp.]|jgi:hypothetical protein|nr:hypothetical protein [Treponema sp.]
MIDSPDEPSGRVFVSPNFDRVLDDACARLGNKKAELSVKKICLLEEELAKMEQELDEFIARKP